MPLAGTNASGISTGTPQKTDNTGRDVGEALGIGASVIGAILSFGTGAPALATADAAMLSANAVSDVNKNKSDANDQQRSEQGSLDAKQKSISTMAPPAMAGIPGEYHAPKGIGSGQVLKNASQVQQGSPNMPVSTQGINFQGFNRPPLVEQTPSAVNAGSTTLNGMSGDIGTTTSDKRAKTSIKSGNQDAEDFLNLVRKMGAWPKGIPDVQ